MESWLVKVGTFICFIREFIVHLSKDKIDMGELIAILLILFFTIKDWNKPKTPPKYRGHV